MTLVDPFQLGIFSDSMSTSVDESCWARALHEAPQLSHHSHSKSAILLPCPQEMLNHRGGDIFMKKKQRGREANKQKEKQEIKWHDKNYQEKKPEIEK